MATRTRSNRSFGEKQAKEDVVTLFNRKYRITSGILSRLMESQQMQQMAVERSTIELNMELARLLIDIEDIMMGASIEVATPNAASAANASNTPNAAKRKQMVDASCQASMASCVQATYRTYKEVLFQQLISLEAVACKLMFRHPYLQIRAHQLIAMDYKYMRLPMIKSGFLFSVVTTRRPSNYVAGYQRLHS